MEGGRIVEHTDPTREYPGLRIRCRRCGRLLRGGKSQKDGIGARCRRKELAEERREAVKKNYGLFEADNGKTDEGRAGLLPDGLHVR